MRIKGEISMRMYTGMHLVGWQYNLVLLLLLFFIIWAGWGWRARIIKQKDEDIGYLKASYLEIAQRLTLQHPPNQEEATKKGWWQFWK